MSSADFPAPFGDRARKDQDAKHHGNGRNLPVGIAAAGLEQLPALPKGRACRLAGGRSVHWVPFPRFRAMLDLVRDSKPDPTRSDVMKRLSPTRRENLSYVDPSLQ
jgi:hypothetical protein